MTGTFGTIKLLYVDFVGSFHNYKILSTNKISCNFFFPINYRARPLYDNLEDEAKCVN